jgi:two-component system chemotaxis response regulator CheY
MTQTIMIVDDSPTLVKFVTVSLRNHGFSVVSASDGMDAIEKLSSLDKDVDLIITDLNMPNLDGYGLIETLRQNERHSRTPIIILTSEEAKEDQERGMLVGADSYLVKPFKSSVLIAEVDKFLKSTTSVKR